MSAQRPSVEVRSSSDWRRRCKRLGLLLLMYLGFCVAGVLAPVWGLGLLVWLGWKWRADRLELVRLLSHLK